MYGCGAVVCLSVTIWFETIEPLRTTTSAMLRSIVVEDDTTSRARFR
jgi:hypothetical protein